MLQVTVPGRLRRTGWTIPGPAWITWFAVVGGVDGARRRARDGADRRSREAAGLAAALFLLPVVVVGLWHWSSPDAPAQRAVAPASSRPSGTRCRSGSIVYSDQETSYRIAALAPVYVAVAPPGNVANTEANRPYERAADAKRFLRTGDLSIPERYGAEYVVVDRTRTDVELELEEVFRDSRFMPLPACPRGRSPRRPASRS